MVNLMLMISGDLDNIASLEPQGGVDDPNYTYFFKLRCSNCGEVSGKETCVTLSESVDVKAKGKGTTNLLQKCKFCLRDGTVTMIPGRGKPLTEEVSQAGGFAPLMLFDFRGFEPEGFVFADGWKAESSAGSKYENIDLSGGEFDEYDEKGECPVMISNLRSKFDVVKI